MRAIICGLICIAACVVIIKYVFKVLKEDEENYNNRGGRFND